MYTFGKTILLVVACIFIFACQNNQVRELPVDHPILGKWEVIDAKRVPFDVDSFCDGLNIGTIFFFHRNYAFVIYNESTKACNIRQLFWLDTIKHLTKPEKEEIETRLVIWEYDVGISLTIEKLTDSIMELSSDQFRQYYIGDVKRDSVDQSNFSNINKITLAKLKDGG